MASGIAGSAATMNNRCVNSNELNPGNSRSNTVTDLVQNLEQNLVLNSASIPSSPGFESGPESFSNFLDIDAAGIVLVDQFFRHATKGRVK